LHCKDTIIKYINKKSLQRSWSRFDSMMNVSSHTGLGDGDLQFVGTDRDTVRRVST